MAAFHAPAKDTFLKLPPEVKKIQPALSRLNRKHPSHQPSIFHNENLANSKGAIGTTQRATFSLPCTLISLGYFKIMPNNNAENDSRADTTSQWPATSTSIRRETRDRRELSDMLSFPSLSGYPSSPPRLGGRSSLPQLPHSIGGQDRSGMDDDHRSFVLHAISTAIAITDEMLTTIYQRGETTSIEEGESLSEADDDENRRQPLRRSSPDGDNNGEQTYDTARRWSPRDDDKSAR